MDEASSEATRRGAHDPGAAAIFPPVLHLLGGAGGQLLFGPQAAGQAGGRVGGLTCGVVAGPGAAMLVRPGGGVAGALHDRLSAMLPPSSYNRLAFDVGNEEPKSLAYNFL